MSRAKWQVVRFIPATIHQGGRLALGYHWRAPGEAKRKLYRVALNCPDTRENRRRWEPQKKQIEAEIISGTFSPEKWFGIRGVTTAVDMPRTLGEIVTQYIEQLAGSDQTERSRNDFARDMHNYFFGTSLEHALLAELNDGHLIAWRGALIARGDLKSGTVNKLFQRVKTVVNVAFRRGLIPRPQSPAALVKSLRDDDREEINPFTPDEFVRLLNAAVDEQRRALYLVAGSTGMRPAELSALPWSNVDFAANVIRVRQQQSPGGKITQRLKTRGSRRDIEMLPIVRETLNEQRARTGLGGVFVFTRDGRYGALNPKDQGDRPWGAAIKRAGLEYRKFYSLRHTYVSLMLAAGKPIQWIAAQLGHTSIEQINRTYGRWLNMPTNERLDLDALAARIRGSHAARKTGTGELG